MPMNQSRPQRERECAITAVWDRCCLRCGFGARLSKYVPTPHVGHPRSCEVPCELVMSNVCVTPALSQSRSRAGQLPNS